MSLTFTVDHLNATDISGCLSGTLWGAFSGSAYGITASLSSFTGYLNGFLSGSYILSSSQIVYVNKPIIKRSLLQFDLTSISASISRGDILNPKFYLTLKVSEAKLVDINYTIYCYPISASVSSSGWSMGTGVFAFGGSPNGANWLYSNSPYTNSIWYTGENVDNIAYGNYLTASSTASFTRGGGVWYYIVPPNISNGSGICSNISASSLICSQSFNYQSSDIRMDITRICNAWLCGAIPNYGLILLSSAETDLNSPGSNLKFFSKETNTIYTPYIDVGWDDSSFNTSSLAPITSSLGVNITIKNLKQSYKAGSMPKFIVFGREKYPQKIFSQLQTPYLIPKYLPSSSYYSIKDNESEETVIDFDDYTKLSCDSNGNYFFLDTTSLPQERYYRILIKSTFDNGDVEIFDNGSIFKVVR